MRGKILFFSSALLAVLVAWAAFRTPSVDLDSALAGKRVLVCGASQGIGRAIALKYASHGAHVAISSRKRPLLETLAKEMTKANSSAKAVVVPGDLSNKDEAKRVVAEAAAALGGDLDVLVLNHIRPYMDAFEDMDDDLIQSVIDVNFVSYVFLTKEALPMLRRSRGTLVAISSVAGQIPVPYVALYSGLKHALHGFYDSLRSELVKLYGDPRVSITTCVIGVIGTESQLEVSKGILDDYKRETPENAATAIVTHAAAGTHTMFFPTMEGWPISFLHPLAPRLFDPIIRMNIGSRPRDSKK